MASSTWRAFYFCIFVLTFCSREAKSDLEAGTVREKSPVVTLQVTVNVSHSVAVVDDEFLCATVDWWPSTKCDYGTCSWHQASLLNLDVSNSLLEQALTALAPFKLRLGGTLQDLVVYDVGAPIEPCVPFVFNSSTLFSFSGGCLSMDRWDALNKLFLKTGVSVAFGLNVLYGRSKVLGELKVTDPWIPNNAADLIRFSHDRGYPVTAWELGNELLGSTGIGRTITPELYAEDMKKLRAIVDEVYRQDHRKPLVVAPDSFYTPGSPEIPQFLQAAGPKVVDVVTRHIYNLGPGVASTSELVDRIRNPAYANGELENYKGLQAELRNQSGIIAWVGEAGGAYNSGHHGVTDAFIFAFWYLDQLGTAAKYDNQAFCRQSLIGGNYGLLNTTTYEPNPDFYGALLWSELMGNQVFSAHGTDDIRAYAHCQKNNKGGLTLLLLNYSNTTTYDLEVSLSGLSANSTSQAYERSTKSSDPKYEMGNIWTGSRLEYHMSPAEGRLDSEVVLLNGRPLRVTPSGKLPKLVPRVVDNYEPIRLDPLTYAYVVLQDVAVDVCSSLNFGRPSKPLGGN